MPATPGRHHVLEVWGDFACFSRPELAVERYSYPCPTPSAARGIFEAIYYKPQFYWQVTRIEILARPAYIALRRNEVKEKISVAAVKKWMKGRPHEPVLADADKSVTGSAQKGRTQRQTMALRQPRFRLHARIVPRGGGGAPRVAYDSQFVRRASQGKCFHQPSLGCREFVAFFRLVKELHGEPAPYPYSQDLGFMLYDVFNLVSVGHAKLPQNGRDVGPEISMFEAHIREGILDVPPFTSDAVLKSQRPAKDS